MERVTLSSKVRCIFRGIQTPDATWNWISAAISSNTSAAYTVIVTDDLKFNGTANVTLNSNYSSLPGGVFAIKNAVFVE